MVDAVLAIAPFVAGVVLAAVSQIVLQEPLHHFLARIISGGLPRPGRHVRGIWECCYRYPSKGVFRYEQQLMLLSQVGPFVVARNVTSQSHVHRLSGRLKSATFLTGRWENLAEGEIWHGTFQFVLHNSGNTMLGKWLGFDSEGTVEHGPWAWKLVSRDTSKASVGAVRDDWNPDGALVALCRPPQDGLRDLVRRYGEAWTSQDADSLGSIFTSDAIYQERAFDRPLRGLAEIRQYWERKVRDQQASIQFRILSLHGGGGTGVAEWEAEFDDLVQGVRKQMREVAILELSDGKIASLREYWSSRRV
jgi:ketosteroid isomerase-like protein